MTPARTIPKPRRMTTLGSGAFATTTPSGPVPNRIWTPVMLLAAVTPEMFNVKDADPITLGPWPVIDGFAFEYNPDPSTLPRLSGPMIMSNGLPPAANGPAVSSVYIMGAPPTP